MKMRILTLIVTTGVLAGIVTSCEEDVKVSSIELDQVSADVMVGSTLNLNVIINPVDATNKNISWESDNTDAATVDDGVVTGVALGVATITAVSQADTSKKASCEISVIPSNGQQITVTGDITADTRWYANARYFLSGFVFVKNDATLTIEPGTIIKGVSGTKAALIIERGSKIMAQGTSSAPIIFTSDKPTGQRSYGDWGGLVICGKATTNKHDSGVGVGIAEGGIGSYYGGTNDADNSGVLQYVRIEFPGIALTSTSNSEINGLTLYAVGSGTTIDHIQVSYSGDDSYEWFGGTVNLKYIVALRGWDDDFDTDNGYRGKVQFALGIRDHLIADQSSSNGFESDNDADGSQTTPVTAPVFSNVTSYGPYAVSTTNVNSLYKRAMHLRRSTQTSVYNSVFVGWPKGLIIDGTTGNSPTMAENNTLQIEKTILAGMGANFEVASGSPVTPYTTTQLQAYFEATSRGNADNLTVADIIGSSSLSLTAPSLLPASGSVLLTGASFTNSRLTSGFDVVTYRGAFGTTNWTTGWCNFDPQNAVY
ncbi:MAG: Ig-like domain-containing protein [Bacteroidales bacterium]|nr:Ig-like domain-containing protein [Bacteroidales bacterium]